LLPKEKKRTFNLIVAGESGNGKSTGIAALFELNLSPEFEIKRQMIYGSTVDVVPKSYKLIVDPFEIEVTAIDTPGYGSTLSLQESFNKVLLEIQKRFEGHNKDSKANEKNNGIVDVCFYFISTPRLKIFDLEFIKQLKEYVTVIPIIAKADTLTKLERENFRSLVQTGLEGVIPVDKLFTLVSTPDERKYEYGTVKPWSDHCELYDNSRLQQYIASNFTKLKEKSITNFTGWKLKGCKEIIIKTKMVHEQFMVVGFLCIFFLILAVVVRPLLLLSK